ncbi:transcriptional regulator, LysR family [Shewanella sediminis HAW-EB3]|uniref:Transcriptional regulator, LysR family n=1 Tax=Shewanella sediminis (strain HAW-EB3) TaxID=425104 RepID=A8FY63_SHESH|nr:LysR family transcriptional regulator [Shewanella sediminis]ABV37786.1 transcriptional regulator, LysR family [Shewanella sediminis HAW-EB3]
MTLHKQFDVNLLRVFLAVCRTGSYTLAADELDLTQPSVSNAISRFKAVIGEELFVRSGRNIKPTAMANYLYEQLNDSFSNIEQTISGLEGFNAATSERQFVILAGDVVSHFLQPALEKIVKDLPIEIVFREPPDHDEDIMEKLYLEQADLVIDMQLPMDLRFEKRLLMRELPICVVSKEHPRIGDKISRDEYFDERHVVIKMRRFNLTAVDLLTDEVLPARKVYSVKSSLLTAFDSLASSDSLCISPRRYAEEYTDMFNLKLLEPPFKMNGIDIEMVWKRKHDKNPAHIWLREQVLSLVK